MERIELTVCVIGQNQGQMLKKVYQSITPLLTMGIKTEVIYVDSCSSDNSVDIACLLFDKVYVVRCEPYTSAAAGRYVGTLHASGRWILYLDGDMTLAKDFYGIVRNVVKEKMCGDIFIGNTVDVNLETGKLIREIKKFERSLLPWRKEKPFFGGAVLVRRECILQAGNWTPWLFANEERELLSRVWKKYHIVYIDVPMVFHWTKQQRARQKLLEVFFPLNKKFFGLGQILIRGFPLKAWRLIIVYPDIFLPWFLGALGMLTRNSLFDATLALILGVILLLLSGLRSQAVLALSLPAKIVFTIIFSRHALCIPSVPRYHTIKAT